MMGLGDRVEAWARRFGVPPPRDLREREDHRPEDEDEEGDDRPPRRPASDRFTHQERDRG